MTSYIIIWSRNFEVSKVGDLMDLGPSSCLYSGWCWRFGEMRRCALIFCCVINSKHNVTWAAIAMACHGREQTMADVDAIRFQTSGLIHSAHSDGVPFSTSPVLYIHDCLGFSQCWVIAQSLLRKLRKKIECGKSEKWRPPEEYVATGAVLTVSMESMEDD